MNEPRFDYEVAEEVGKRLDVFFEGLPKENVQAALEELFDDYALATFGVSVFDNFRKVKLPGKGQCITTQVMAEGRAVLISAYGFKLVKESKCGKCKQHTITLDEQTRRDMERDRESMG
jgi:formate dehydrogenase assembly factor FdhD